MACWGAWSRSSRTWWSEISRPDLGQQVHNVAFRKPPLGQRGYDDEEVDAFLDWLESALTRGDDAPGIAARITQAIFRKPPIGKRGYSVEDVDGFLDGIVTALGVRPSTAVDAHHGDAQQTRAQRSAVVEHEGGFFSRLFRR